MLDRCRDLVQHLNQPRLMAAEATDEDDEEAQDSYHHTHPPRGSSLSWVFLLVASAIPPQGGGQVNSTEILRTSKHISRITSSFETPPSNIDAARASAKCEQATCFLAAPPRVKMRSIPSSRDGAERDLF